MNILFNLNMQRALLGLGLFLTMFTPPSPSSEVIRICEYQSEEMCEKKVVGPRGEIHWLIVPKRSDIKPLIAKSK